MFLTQMLTPDRSKHMCTGQAIPRKAHVQPTHTMHFSGFPSLTPRAHETSLMYYRPQRLWVGSPVPLVTAATQCPSGRHMKATESITFKNKKIMAFLLYHESLSDVWSMSNTFGRGYLQCTGLSRHYLQLQRYLPAYYNRVHSA